MMLVSTKGTPVSGLMAESSVRCSRLPVAVPWSEDGDHRRNPSAPGSPGALGASPDESSLLVDHRAFPLIQRALLLAVQPFLARLAPVFPARGRREHSGHRRVDEGFRVAIDP